MRLILGVVMDALLYHPAARGEQQTVERRLRDVTLQITPRQLSHAGPIATFGRLPAPVIRQPSAGVQKRTKVTSDQGPTGGGGVGPALFSGYDSAKGADCPIQNRNRRMQQ
jgi:hypothetical protein